MAGLLPLEGVPTNAAQRWAGSVSSLLALRGLDRNALDIDEVCRLFLDTPTLLDQTQVDGSSVTLPQANEYQKISLKLESQRLQQHGKWGITVAQERHHLQRLRLALKYLE